MASRQCLLKLLVLLSLASWQVSAITCHCEHAKCTEIEVLDCPAGSTNDMCSCCTVCAGAIGEECGGPWNIYGDCGTGLECHQKPCPSEKDDPDCYLFYLTEPGECVEKKRRSILDLFASAHEAGVDEIRDRRRLRLLHELEKLKRRRK